MNRSVRSSRVTGPKMRVPIGSSLALSSTAALVSKRHLGAVVAAHAVPRANDDCVVDLALLDAAAGRGVLDGDLDYVADVRIAALGPAEHLDAHHATGTGVVGDVQYRLHLDHCCFSNFIRVARRSGLRKRAVAPRVCRHPAAIAAIAAASFGPRSGNGHGRSRDSGSTEPAQAVAGETRLWQENFVRQAEWDVPGTGIQPTANPAGRFRPALDAAAAARRRSVRRSAPSRSAG